MLTNEDWDLEKACLMLKKKAFHLSCASVPPEGRYPVIMAPQVVASFIHEVGHALEADFVLTNKSVFKGRLGTQVASEHVTIVDDPRQDSIGKLYYDSEGTPAQPIILIEKGCLQGYLHNLKTAMTMGVSIAGRGRSHDHRYSPLVRMSNIYISWGIAVSGFAFRDRFWVLSYCM